MSSGTTGTGDGGSGSGPPRGLARITEAIANAWWSLLVRADTWLRGRRTP